MPNHVYNRISFTDLSDEQRQKLEVIASTLNGLCGYYVPMPDDIRNTTSPTKVVTQREYNKIMKENAKITDEDDPYGVRRKKVITKKMQVELLRKYGVDNWYDWAFQNWGTKWGCYDHEVDGDTIRFSTAWAPFNLIILESLAVDFPNFILHYEEEQGWGGYVEYENGEFSLFEEYEAPQWEGTGIETDDGQITKLMSDICESPIREGVEAGYYYDYSEYEPVPQELLDQHNLS